MRQVFSSRPSGHPAAASSVRRLTPTLLALLLLPAATVFGQTRSRDILAPVRAQLIAAHPVSGPQARPESDNDEMDLFIFDPQVIPAGAYHDITVLSGGEATLGGDITVSGTLLVQGGGQFASRPFNPFGGGNSACFSLTGTGSFTLAAGAVMIICSPDGITTTGATGAVQVTGARTYSPHALYVYDGQDNGDVQATGAGLPSRVLGLYNFKFSPVGGLVLTRPVRIRFVLGIAGNISTAGQSMTLLSDRDTTATVLDIDFGLRVSGDVTVQQYITPNPGAAVGYRFLSSPVENSTVADLAVPGVFTPIVNGAYNTNPNARPMPNVFGYDERRGDSDAPFMVGYFSPAPVGAPRALTAPLVPGRGYSVAMRAATVDFVGTLNASDITVPNLTRTGSPRPGAKAGHHLLGNPYASPLDANQLPLGEAMAPTIYVQKTLGGNNYVYLTWTQNAGGGTGTLPDGVLSIAQGFFAQVTGEGPVDFTFTNDMRANSLEVNAPHYPTARAAARPSLLLTLRAPGAPADEQDAAFVLVTPGNTPDARLA
ncbi:MAG: hypothetical protein H7330_14970, partial [Hymenobacteraceae bacterium]|nr:hypothetical protein [Hymenobacteraceae bacterium]